MTSSPLVCPTCASAHDADERFCPACGMPLVHRDEGEGEVSARHARARKVKPQYTEGRLVRVARASNQAEAELIQGMLLEEGVPSMLQRARGFDVPDMLAAGPRDVMVAASGVATAREVLLQAEMIAPPSPASSVNAARLLGGLLAAVALVAIVAWLGTELLA